MDNFKNKALRKQSAFCHLCANQLAVLAGLAGKGCRGTLMKIEEGNKDNMSVAADAQ